MDIWTLIAYLVSLSVFGPALLLFVLPKSEPARAALPMPAAAAMPAAATPAGPSMSALKHAAERAVRRAAAQDAGMRRAA